MSHCHRRERTYVYVEESESCGSTETGSEYESASSDSEEECEHLAQRQSSSRILSGIGSGSQVAGEAGSAAFGNTVSVTKGGGETRKIHRQGCGDGGDCGCGCGGVGGGGGGGVVRYSNQQQQGYNSHKARQAGLSIKQQQHNSSCKSNGNQRLQEQHNYQQQYSKYEPSAPSRYEEGFKELPLGAADQVGAKHTETHRIKGANGYTYDQNVGPSLYNFKSNNYAPSNYYYENCNRQQLCDLDTGATQAFALDDPHMATVEEACISYFRKTKINGGCK